MVAKDGFRILPGEISRENVQQDISASGSTLQQKNAMHSVCKMQNAKCMHSVCTVCAVCSVQCDDTTEAEVTGGAAS